MLQGKRVQGGRDIVKHLNQYDISIVYEDGFLKKLNGNYIHKDSKMYASTSLGYKVTVIKKKFEQTVINYPMQFQGKTLLSTHP